MNARSIFPWLALVAVACGPEAGSPGGDGTWVGSVTTEGDVTTVVNESGSLWGGPGILIEEASIGVDVGEPQYMLGRVIGIAATADRIFVLDSSTSAVRIYDYGGVHMRDLGGPGQGPGELNDPRALAVADDATVYVFTGDLRVQVFSPDGEPAGTRETHAGARYRSGRMPVVAADGTLWVPDYVMESPEDLRRREGMRAVGPEGPADAPVLAPPYPANDFMLINEFGNARIGRPVPFAPSLSWAFSTTGAMVSGFSSEYRFEIRDPDGAVTVVTASWQPVPISAEQIEWNRRSVTASMHRSNPEWQWNAAEIPSHAPPFLDLEVGSDGRIWVRRITAINRIEGCDPDTPDPSTGRTPNCWRSEIGYDVFGVDGRRLGAVPGPAASLRLPVFAGDHLIAYTEDAAGVGMVKRYRLVTPEQR